MVIARLSEDEGRMTISSCLAGKLRWIGILSRQDPEGSLCWEARCTIKGEGKTRHIEKRIQ